MIGHVPFEAPTVEEVIVAQVQTPLTPPNLVVPEITQPTSDALVKAMAKNPGGPLSQLRGIHHGAGSRAQPAGREAIPKSAIPEVQKPHQLVEAGIKKAGVAARLEISKQLRTLNCCRRRPVAPVLFFRAWRRNEWSWR